MLWPIVYKKLTSTPAVSSGPWFSLRASSLVVAQYWLKLFSEVGLVCEQTVLAKLIFGSVRG